MNWCSKACKIINIPVFMGKNYKHGDGVILFEAASGKFKNEEALLSPSQNFLFLAEVTDLPF
jgi:hypothetical protein